MIAPADPTAIQAAAAHLRAGRLVAFPTETVYGLGADATSAAAVRAIYRAKGRPPDNPLIVHVPDLAAIATLARLDDRAHLLAAAFWPGPLTLVLPALPTSPISPYVTANLASVAIRIPAHPVARALARATGLPIAAPSANPSGRISPTTADHVEADLGDAVAMVLDGGPCAIGLESSVVDLSHPDPPTLLRPGGIPREALEAALHVALADPPVASVNPASPGQLPSHYAPNLPLRLDAETVRANEALIAFGPHVPPGAFATFNLSSTGDLDEAATNLFALLRQADGCGATAIAVVPIMGQGPAEAIRDRLRRAAAP